MKQLDKRLPVKLGLLFKCTETRGERAPQTHQLTDAADIQPENLPDDPTEHPWHDLPRMRPLRMRQKQKHGLALRFEKAEFVYHKSKRQ